MKKFDLKKTVAKARSLDYKKLARDFVYGKPAGERRLGDLYMDKTGLYKHREWRGIKDTLVDYGWWCVMWKDMIKFVLQSPLQVVKGIFRYRWMLTYLTLPQFIDRQLEGMRGVQLRAGHALYDIIIKHTIDIIADSLSLIHI